MRDEFSEAMRYIHSVNKPNLQDKRARFFTNWFLPEPGGPRVIRVAALPDDEESGVLALLRAARSSRKQMVQDEARAYYDKLESESRAVELDEQVRVDAIALRGLTSEIFERKNKRLLSIFHRQEALSLIAANIARGSRSLNPIEVRRKAKQELSSYKSTARKKSMTPSIVPVELPHALEIDSENLLLKPDQIDAEPVRELYKLDFIPNRLRVLHSVMTCEEPIVERTTPIFTIHESASSQNLIASNNQPISDDDRYFVLGLIQRTRTALLEAEA